MKRQQDKQMRDSQSNENQYKKNRKRAWTHEEDSYLMRLVQKYGAQKWTLIAEHLTGRIGKQCRERWHNHINPNVNKEEWNFIEEWKLYLLHKNLGNQWAYFMRYFNGRTDNAIKNHWNSSMKKKIKDFNYDYHKIIQNVSKDKDNEFKWKIDRIDHHFLEFLSNPQNKPQMVEKFIEKQSNRKLQKTSIKHIQTPIKSNNNIKSLQQTSHKRHHIDESKQKQPIFQTQVRRVIPERFNPISARLSQLSLFCNSKPNIESIEVLEQQNPNFLINPSFNDISLSLKCIPYQQDQLASEHQEKEVISHGYSLRSRDLIVHQESEK